MTVDTLEPKWVIVTGAASGIGAGVARVLSGAGFGVILVDIDEASLAPLEAELPLARSLAVDVTEQESALRLEAVCREVANPWGLVNCAGIALVKHFLLNTEAEWTRILRVNLEGTFRATHAVAKVLYENGGGAIVNIASVSGVNPAALQAAYAASKAGVIGFTTGVAFDFGPLDITINAICPGVVRTPIWERILDAESAETGVPADEIFAKHVRPIPLGRAQTPEDIGNVALYLLGPQARNISGTAINVTGGMTTVVLDHLAGAEQLRQETEAR
ncbi:SDR family NAD(P)-dependent oxidoreductase [Micromonospora sp. NPDC048830]|uniref:SDR family NAD(P)-dependent oxidoreductase n=1 Tax=Micromonospora sp. NPDC048830 TaxID=3364257 RepID=UPI0037103178